MRRNVRSVSVFFILSLAFSAGALRAQTPNGVCDSKGATPCINQPLDTQRQVSGKVAKGSGVTIKVNDKQLSGTATVKDDGTFTIAVDPALKTYDTIEADQTNPTGSAGPVVVRAQTNCDSNPQPLPCLDQPHEGDTTVTGNLKPANGDKPMYSVDLKVNGVSVQGPQTIDKNAHTFSNGVNALSRYDTIEAGQGGDVTGTAGPVTVAAPATAVSGQSLYTLGMAGIDISSTTANGPQQQYYAEFRLTAPIGRQDGDPLDSSVWVWFNPRIASVPAAGNIALGSLTSVGTALSGLGQQTLTSITQSVELHGGLELALIKPRNGKLFGSAHKASLGFSLIGGGGILTPFNPQSGDTAEFDLAASGSTAGSPASVAGVLQQFQAGKNGAALQAAFPDLFNKLTACSKSATNSCPQQVAFVLPTRSRFFRSYAAGFRLKTFFFDSDCNKDTIDPLQVAERCRALDVFPGTLDLTVGQDESVTGGILHKTVLTLSANYPMPGLSWLRIFGSAYFALARNQSIPTLALSPTQTAVPLNSSTLFTQFVPAANQDYLRIGFGIDIVKAYQAFIGSSKSSAPTGTSAAPATGKGSTPASSTKPKSKGGL